MTANKNAETIFVPQCWEDLELTLQKNKLDELRRLNYGRETIALLLHGNAGLGKTALARFLARSLACHGVCESLDDPCGTCSACKLNWTSRRWGDNGVAEIDCTGGTPADVVDRIDAHTKYRSVCGVGKLNKSIVILDEVHRNRGVLSDRLLKMLEEPSGNVFLLVTNKPDVLEEAVIQRCLDYELRKPDLADAQNWLQGVLARNEINASVETIAGLVGESNGIPRLIRSAVRRRMRVGDDGLTTIDLVEEEAQI